MSPRTVSFELQRQYYNLCNPGEALEPDDGRYVDVDATRLVRGAQWTHKLARRIGLSLTPICELFTGLPGSGKSTELGRLVEILGKKKKGASLLCVLVDAEDAIDLGNPIDVPDILGTILYRVDGAVLKAEGKDPEGALGEGRIRRLLRWFSETEVELKGGDLGVSAKVAVVPGGPELTAGGKIVFDLKSNPSLRKTVRDRVARHMTTFIQEVREELTELEKRAKAKGHSGILVVFDSLEKLRGMSTNWTEVLQSAERIFGSGAPYLTLPIHVIYTIPPALALRLNIPVHFLPMLKLVDREGKRAAGFDAALEIVRNRVPDAALGEFIGGAKNREDRVRRLIEFSGGYPREIVRMLQNVIAEPVSDDESFRSLLSQAGEAYVRTVTRDAYAWLARVHVEKDVSIENEAHREIADRMLSNNVVLRYQNEKAWYDVHPAVLGIAGVVSEIELLRAKGKTAP
jgi:hypothetical protein